MTDTPFETWGFKATGGTTNRTMPDRLADVVNVKDYGANGNGSGDDRAACQAAIDAAFGSSSSPNGVNAHLNRPLYFPKGKYPVSSALNLTQVRGGLIYGDGMFSTSVQNVNAGGKTFVTNGFEYCAVENMLIGGGGAGGGKIPFELDWTGTPSAVGLSNNVFRNITFESGDYAVRVGLSGNGGSFNRFDHCLLQHGSVAGLVIWSANSFGNVMVGGGATDCAIAYWTKAGQIAMIANPSTSGNSTCDVQVDTAFPIAISGGRSESQLAFIFNHASGCAHISCFVANGASAGGRFCKTKAKTILDSCTVEPTNIPVFCDAAGYTGVLYRRGKDVYPAGFLTGWLGTTPQDQ